MATKHVLAPWGIMILALWLACGAFRIGIADLLCTLRNHLSSPITGSFPWRPAGNNRALNAP